MTGRQSIILALLLVGLVVASMGLIRVIRTATAQACLGSTRFVVVQVTVRTTPQPMPPGGVRM